MSLYAVVWAFLMMLNECLSFPNRAIGIPIGCSPALPSLLNAAGFDRTAITRVDGMFFMGCDLENPRRFPRPGSSAERLLKQERTLDLWWRDRNGAQVLCHWNAFTYGQGDMLAYVGLSRVYLARSTFNNPCDNPERALLHNLVAATVTTDSPDVWVTAVKPASRGEGVIVRLYTPALPESPVMVTVHHLPVKGAFLCDARERDLGQLEVQDGTVRVAMPGTVATIRLLQG